MIIRDATGRCTGRSETFCVCYVEMALKMNKLLFSFVEIGIFLVCSMFHVSAVAQDEFWEKRMALQIIGLKMVCLEWFPDISNNINVHQSSEKSGMPANLRRLIAVLEESKDSYVQGQVNAAYIFSRDRDVVSQMTCSLLAGEASD